jgi:hypothetical protein
MRNTEDNGDIAKQLKHLFIMTTYYFIENVTYTNFDDAYKALSNVVTPNASLALDILQVLGGNTMKHLENVITNMVNSGYVWDNKEEILQLLPYNTKLYIDYVLRTYYPEIYKEDLIRAKYGLN